MFVKDFLPTNKINKTNLNGFATQIAVQINTEENNHHLNIEFYNRMNKLLYTCTHEMPKDVVDEKSIMNEIERTFGLVLNTNEKLDAKLNDLMLKQQQNLSDLSDVKATLNDLKLKRQQILSDLLEVNKELEELSFHVCSNEREVSKEELSVLKHLNADLTLLDIYRIIESVRKFKETEPTWKLVGIHPSETEPMMYCFAFELGKGQILPLRLYL